MDADCHEEEEVVAVRDWMDCTKLLLEVVGDSFTVCGISNNMASFLSSQKVIFLYCLTVVEEEVANVNRCYS